MISKEERLLARQLFKCRAIVANGRAFQDFFWDIMKAKHGDKFSTVAPQGRKGDGGNDGYLPAAKHYFQLYAPITPREKIATAAKKLKADFVKIQKEWGRKATPIERFSFVFNDKYQGLPNDIEQALNDLRAKHKNIIFAQYCCRDLEQDFMGLPETEWDRILGMPVPDPGRIKSLDYSVLAEVIRYIMAADIADAESRLDLPPELDEKIRLNKLRKTQAIHIQNGALLTGHIDKFFAKNSSFALSALRDHVVGYFETAKKVVADDPPPKGTTVDAVFDLFRRSLFPKNATTATANAVDAVIGYFFEACDVFDPKADKSFPGASPR
jgi:hypothetical protein